MAPSLSCIVRPLTSRAANDVKVYSLHYLNIRIALR